MIQTVRLGVFIREFKFHGLIKNSYERRLEKKMCTPNIREFRSTGFCVLLLVRETVQFFIFLSFVTSLVCEQSKFDIFCFQGVFGLDNVVPSSWARMKLKILYPNHTCESNVSDNMMSLSVYLTILTSHRSWERADK